MIDIKNRLLKFIKEPIDLNSSFNNIIIDINYIIINISLKDNTNKYISLFIRKDLNKHHIKIGSTNKKGDNAIRINRDIEVWIKSLLDSYILLNNLK